MYSKHSNSKHQTFNDCYQYGTKKPVCKQQTYKQLIHILNCIKMILILRVMNGQLSFNDDL